MKELILVKLGGSVITDKSKPYTARQQVLNRLVKEIHSAREKKKFSLIIGNGAGSFGHQSAHKYSIHKGLLNSDSVKGFALVQKDAALLNRLVVDSLLEAGENAVSIQPSAAAIASDSRIKKWFLPSLKKMLELNLVPVPYGDPAIDLKQGVCILSTDEIFFYLAKELRAKKVVMVSVVDGVLDSEKKVIPEISSKNFNQVKNHLTGANTIDVTGGMLHKVERMLELAKHGTETIIINGDVPGRLEDSLLGKKVVGTRIKN